ncbi:MAG TPA: DUF3307 domain-containing protein [Acidobacteriaceae bacterium]|jgi:hypothetical protein|nr:DUF3307 domain-containing protein [Acidobacteriaceae bacterium]
MQPLPAAFAALLLAHLLADFPLQSAWIIRNKGARLSALLSHGAIHYLAAWACLIFSGQLRFLSPRNQAILAACILLHLAIDRIKSILIARSLIRDNGWTFLADQILHLVVLAAAALLLTRSHLADLAALMQISPFARARILETAIVYASAVFGGGYLIRYLTRGLAQGIGAESQSQLGNAGLYIGWIERALVVTAMAMQSPALVGLILTSKSIARFPEFREARFAEYFLIGTLLSFSLSVLGGIVLLRLLYGTVSLK